MEIRTYPVGALQTNCYIVWASGADTCILIDPGDEPQKLLEQLRQLRKTPEAILLTHGHFDHVGAVRQIASETGCHVYISQEDLLLDPRITGGQICYTHTYAQGDLLTLAGLSWQVLATPGHTPGSVCLLCGSYLFSGDTLFAGTCGRTDLPGGDPAQMQRSLHKLAALEGDLVVFPGHGEDTTLDIERKTNPFMGAL